MTQISLEARYRACPAHPPHAALPAPPPGFVVVGRGNMRAYARGPQLKRESYEPFREGRIAPTPAQDGPAPLGTVHRHGAVKEPERRVTGALEEGTLGPRILSIHMTRRTKIHTGSAISKNPVGYLVGHSAETSCCDPPSCSPPGEGPSCPLKSSNDQASGGTRSSCRLSR